MDGAYTRWDGQVRQTVDVISGAMIGKQIGDVSLYDGLPYTPWPNHLRYYYYSSYKNLYDHAMTEEVIRGIWNYGTGDLDYHLANRSGFYPRTRAANYFRMNIFGEPFQSGGNWYYLLAREGLYPYHEIPTVASTADEAIHMGQFPAADYLTVRWSYVLDDNYQSHLLFDGVDVCVLNLELWGGPYIETKDGYLVFWEYELSVYFVVAPTGAYSTCEDLDFPEFGLSLSNYNVIIEI